MKRIIFAAAATLMFSAVIAANYNKRPKRVKYPAVFWTEHSEKAFEETHSDTPTSLIVDKVKALADESNASRLFIIKKEGLTTRELFRNARYMEYDRQNLLNHSVAFTNFTG